jgi:alpha-1,6-mannosyltransferase
MRFRDSLMAQFDQPVLSAGIEPPLYPLAGIGAIFAGLTLTTPFAFQAGGDNAFIALAIPASLLTLIATRVAERTPTKRALWLIFGIGILLRIFFLIVTRIGENVNVMRMALLGCEAVIVTLVMLFLRRMERPTTRVVSYFWHPLPIWEIANSGHVDALAVALMLLGLWVALSGSAMRGAVVIALGILVKPYVAPALAPIWRPWDWKIPLAVIAVIALCYLPYLSVGSGVFGFLTNGYLTEEGIISGDDLWLLSIWRLVFGAHRIDVAAYAAVAASILLFMGLSAVRRTNRTIASSLADTNMLLLVVLLLLSPNYPWYFLAIMPFVALCGNAPTWVVSIGALLLTDEARWDFQIPKLVVKSILFGGCLLAYAWSARVAHLKQTADMGRSQ